MLSTRDTLQIQGYNYIECGSMKTDMNVSGDHDRAGMAIVTSGKINSRTFTRYKEIL